MKQHISGLFALFCALFLCSGVGWGVDISITSAPVVTTGLVEGQRYAVSFVETAPLGGVKFEAQHDPSGVIPLGSLDASGTLNIGPLVGTQITTSITGGGAGGLVKIVPISENIVGATGGPVIMQESDGVMQTDTLAALNATSVVRECTGFRSVTVHVTASSIVGSVIAETSNDNVTWSTVAAYTTSNIGSQSPGANVSTALGGITQCPTPGKYFRIRCSAYTSGSITCMSFFRSEPIPKIGVYIAGAQTGANAANFQGTAAAGSTATGNPIQQGVIAYTSAPTARTNSTIAGVPATVYGVPIQKPYSIPELDWSYVPPAMGLSNSATAVTIKAAAGAGLRNYITSITMDYVGMATGGEFVILDGSTVIFRRGIYAGSSTIDIDLPTPLKSTANQALSIQTQAAGTATAIMGNIFFNSQGYVAP